MSESSRAPLDVDRLLSGESGIVLGKRARSRALVADVLDDAALWARLMPPRLEKAAAEHPARGSVLVLCVYAGDFARGVERAVGELERSRRDVTFSLGALDGAAPQLAGRTKLEGLRGAGKFENLDALLELMSPEEHAWVLVMDDDVELPRGFLDRFLFLAERFELALVQPALRRTSHAAWRVLRRERWTVARRTRLVEIGPLTAFQRSVVPELLPFPPLWMGWGLDLHWGGLALERGWRLGVVDATPIRHEARVPVTTYPRADAVEELRRFLADRPHIDRFQALEVLERHRSWR